MRTTLFAAALVAVASAAAAQSPTPMLELRPVVGAYLPTGTQRDFFDDAAIYGFQAGIEYRPTLHFVGSFMWSPSHNKFNVTNNRVNMFQYDVGAEFNLLRPIGGGWDLKPFLGIGAGGRTYSYHAASLTDRTCVGGYGAAGTEFQYGAAAIRLEGRNYVSCFRDPVSDKSLTRNDVALSLGLAYHVGHR